MIRKDEISVAHLIVFPLKCGNISAKRSKTLMYFKLSKLTAAVLGILVPLTLVCLGVFCSSAVIISLVRCRATLGSNKEREWGQRFGPLALIS